MNELNSSKSVVSGDTEITGSLTFKGELSFAGKLSGGSITGGTTLLVEKTADIKGNVTADTVRLDGAVSGNLIAGAKCEFGETAALKGDLVTPRLVMADGATFIGQMQIGPLTAESKEKRR